MKKKYLFEFIRNVDLALENVENRLKEIETRIEHHTDMIYNRLVKKDLLKVIEE